jgi:hypothetical protein
MAIVTNIGAATDGSEAVSEILAASETGDELIKGILKLKETCRAAYAIKKINIVVNIRQIEYKLTSFAIVKST